MPGFRLLPSFTLSVFAAVVLAACGGESVAGPPPIASALRVESGNSQIGVVGQRLPIALVVTVLDEDGRPLPDVRVTFGVVPGGGSLAPTAVQTNSEGRAQAEWTLGTQTGTVIATANVSGVSPVTFTATVRAGAAARLVTTPGSLSLGVGDTVRVQANARDQFGNLVDQLALSWSSLEPAIASVSNGLVTALTQGSARVVVSAAGPSGAIADTVDVLVGPPGTSFCGNRTPVSPAVGSVVLLNSAAGSVERCIAAASAGAEFALVALNANPTFTSTTALDALALGVGPAPSASVASAFTAMAPAPLMNSVAVDQRDGGFERALRKRERTELAAHVGVARDRFAGGGRNELSGLSAQIQPPAVGSFVQLNSQPLSACSQPNMRTGRVVAVSQRAVIVADTTNPAGGYTDEEYAAIAATFDTLTYPLDVEYFGEPSNVSGFGRIILFYTRAVNQLTPQGANFIVGGFFFARDLYPRTTRNGLPACANSNEREMMYLLVADPNGVVNGNRRTKADVTRLNRTTVAHEFEHLINSGRRLLVTPNAVTNEEVWLDEGLAHTAEELLYYRLAGFTSRENLGLTQVAPNAARAQIFTDYAAQNFARWTNYLRAPESQSPYASNDSLATRGASWHFLRYAAGRQPQDEAAFYRQLVGGPKVGIENLSAAIPNGELNSWLRDWAVANIADDFAAGVAAQYTVPAWNFRSILPALTLSGQPIGTYPLATRTFTSNVVRRVTLAGGGSSYVRFTVPNAQRALISVSFNGQAPPENVQLAIVRLR